MCQPGKKSMEVSLKFSWMTTELSPLSARLSVVARHRLQVCLQVRHESLPSFRELASHQRVSIFPHGGLTSGEVWGVWGGSLGEVWGISGELLGNLQIAFKERSSRPGKSPGNFWKIREHEENWITF